MITNNTNPKANADKVLGLSNSWSPIKATTIWTVTVVTFSKGLAVKLAAVPAATTTIIVSPIALEIASKKAPTIPGSAAGKITFFIVSALLEPIPRDPYHKLCGNEFITSTDKEEIKGIIITPITKPAAKALVGEASIPIDWPKDFTKGATVTKAKKP